MTLLLWVPVRAVYVSTEPAWQVVEAAGHQIGDLYRAAGGRGGLNLPPDRPDLVYALVRFGGVSGKALVSQLYDPRYYLPPGSPALSNRPAMDQLYGCWLGATQSRLLLVDSRNADYVDLVADQPAWFMQVGNVPALGWTIERVIGSPPSGDCPQH
jgi:hypothetical protein